MELMASFLKAFSILSLFFPFFSFSSLSYYLFLCCEVRDLISKRAKKLRLYIYIYTHLRMDKGFAATR